MIKEKHTNYLPFKNFWQLEEAFNKIKIARIAQQERVHEVYTELGIPHEYGELGEGVAYLMDISPEVQSELRIRQADVHENGNPVKAVFDELKVEIRKN